MTDAGSADPNVIFRRLEAVGITIEAQAATQASSGNLRGAWNLRAERRHHQCQELPTGAIDTPSLDLRTGGLLS